MALLAHTDSDTQSSVWFSAKQITSSEAIRKILSDPRVPKVGYDLKRQRVALSRLGVDLVGLQFDPLIAGHLLDAGQRNQGLSDLLDRFADVDASGGDVQDVPQTAEQAASSCHNVASLIERLSEEIQAGGFGSLFSDVEMPLAEVLSGMESRGVRVDVKLLSGLSEDYSSQIKILEKESHGRRLMSRLPFSVGTPRTGEARGYSWLPFRQR